MYTVQSRSLEFHTLVSIHIQVWNFNLKNVISRLCWCYCSDHMLMVIEYLTAEGWIISNWFSIKPSESTLFGPSSCFNYSIYRNSIHHSTSWSTSSAVWREKSIPARFSPSFIHLAIVSLDAPENGFCVVIKSFESFLTLSVLVI